MRDNAIPKPSENLPTELEIKSGWEKDRSGPLLTVVCTTFNHERFVKDAIHGFLSQKTTFPWQVVIHDDASEDQTPEILRYYQAKYPTLLKVIFQEKNLYSRGIDRAPFLRPFLDVKYLALCEGDDYWLDADKLQRQVSYMEEHPKCVLTYHSFLNVDEESKSILSVGSGPRTVTRVRRNIPVDKGPYTYAGKRIRNGDRVTLFLLQQQGEVTKIDGLEPAVYRHHSGGIWSKKDLLYKQIEAIRTRLYIEKHLVRSSSERKRLRADIAGRLRKLKEQHAQDLDIVLEELAEPVENLWRRYQSAYPYFTKWSRALKKQAIKMLEK
ncbi:MAG: glycosyltransferase [Wenzhouxiangella sp.]